MNGRSLVRIVKAWYALVLGAPVTPGKGLLTPQILAFPSRPRRPNCVPPPANVSAPESNKTADQAVDPSSRSGSVRKPLPEKMPAKHLILQILLNTLGSP